MLNTDSRVGFDETLDSFRDQVRRFLTKHLVPNLNRWEAQGIVDREFWLQCGEAGLLCPTVPEAYGGLGLDFRYNAVIGEEVSYTGSTAGISLQSDIVVDYICKYGTEAQKQKYLPAMIRGECIVAIAMTEPGTGSDLQGIRTSARREQESYVISGAKTYITNGQLANLVIVAAKTNPEAGAKGLSLILVEAITPGFSRGKKLDKIGHHSADTSELFFDNVRVPAENLLGEENRGFRCLMGQLAQERLVIAIAAQAVAQRAFDEAVQVTKDRKAFGQRVFDFQNTRFVLASLASKLQVGWAHIDWAIARHVAGKLTAEQASSAKLWHTEMQWEVVDAALQMHGGAGYMNEYPIARLWRDSRVTRIYGGTSEIMKEIIGRSL
jgi:alkylation response protein AidB-like acyl-CoA dehydrogenase